MYPKPLPKSYSKYTAKVTPIGNDLFLVWDSESDYEPKIVTLTNLLTVLGGATISSTSAILKGDGAGNGTAATPWTDYAPGLPTAAAGGTVDAITATYSPAVTLTNGTRVTLVAAGANTGAVTFTPNGLTTKAIVKYASTALVAGDIPAANYLCYLEYNGTAWVLINPSLEGRLGGASAPDATEIGYSNGVTSAIQTQLDAKLDIAIDIAPADQTTSDPPFTGVAGENLAFGEICYAWFSGGVRKFKKAIGDAGATTTCPAIVMCVNAGGILADASGDFIYSGHVTNVAGWNWGVAGSGLLTQLWLSVTTAGAMQQTVPAVSTQVIQNVADVITADTIFFRPERSIGIVA
jgi:hypothetical protein